MSPANNSSSDVTSTITYYITTEIIMTSIGAMRSLSVAHTTAPRNERKTEQIVSRVRPGDIFLFFFFHISIIGTIRTVQRLTVELFYRRRQRRYLVRTFQPVFITYISRPPPSHHHTPDAHLARGEKNSPLLLTSPVNCALLNGPPFRGPPIRVYVQAAGTVPRSSPTDEHPRRNRETERNRVRE